MVEVKNSDLQRLRKRLAWHRNEFFTILDYYSVRPYNNQVEQLIRPVVISRKISQQNRSRRIDEAQAIMMSLFQTAKLQNKNPTDVVIEQAKQHILGLNTQHEVLQKAA